jgi:uncharacterized protein YdbL (DUF1318 family)
MIFSNILRASAFVIALGASSILPHDAYAFDLDQARVQQQVGEAANGMLVALPGSSGDVRANVQAINAERMEKYEAIAKKRGISVAQVQAIVHKKIIAKLPIGSLYQNNGNWVQK